MYTKGRNSARTNKKVTNWANWSIKWWWIRQILLHCKTTFLALPHLPYIRFNRPVVS